MANYEILNESDEVINVIIADEIFVAANYSNYRLRDELDTTERDARTWRNRELKNTDYIVPLSDHPERDAYLAYRVELRDWSAQDGDKKYTNGFPNVRPELKSKEPSIGTTGIGDT